MKMEEAAVRGWYSAGSVVYSFAGSRGVRTGECPSTPASVAAGVPQGSIISTSSFLIFINNFLQLKLNGKLSVFADDCPIFYSHPEIEVISHFITDYLSKVSHWCSKNKMNINENKTNVVSSEWRCLKLIYDLKYHRLNCIGGNSEAISREQSF